ncbi:MAG: DUF6512 family protein [Cellulosilyticaceae bacterium]
MKKQPLNCFIVSGILFTVIVGTLLHFTYDFFNQNTFVGFFSPINESVWEHLKLGFYSLLLFGLIAYPKVKDNVNNYLFGLAISSLILNIIIIFIFYTYTSFTHSSILFVDISSYILGCIVAIFTFYKIIKLPKLPSYFNYFGLIIIIASVLFFAFFSLYPPSLPIFISPVFISF